MSPAYVRIPSSRSPRRRLLAVSAVAGAIALTWSGPGLAQEAPRGREERPVTGEVAAWVRQEGVDPDSSSVLEEARLAPDRRAVLVRLGLTRPPAGYRLLLVPGAGGGLPWQIAEIPWHWYDIAFELVEPGETYDEIVLRWRGGYGSDFYEQYFPDPARREVIRSRSFRDPAPVALLATERELLAVYDFGDLGQVLLRRPSGPDGLTASLLPFDEPLRGIVESGDTVYLLTDSREWYRRTPGGDWAGRRRPRRMYEPPEGVRPLHPRLPQFRVVPGGIEELRLEDTLFIPLDLPDLEHYRRARPEHAEWVPAPEIRVDVGPVTAHEGRVWFGLTFYDGEGLDGVGGIGWFDPASREAEMIYPDALADWSVSAIAGADGEIVLGLARYPEGATVGGGIGRYEIAGGTLRTLDLPGVVGALAVREDTTYALSTRGLFVVHGEDALRFRLFPDLEGKPIIRRSRVRVAP